MDFLKFLLDRPDPTSFYYNQILVPAPASGLFLADVVYDPQMFTNPVPYYANECGVSDYEYIQKN